MLNQLQLTLGQTGMDTSSKQSFILHLLFLFLILQGLAADLRIVEPSRGASRPNRWTRALTGTACICASAAVRVKPY